MTTPTTDAKLTTLSSGATETTYNLTLVDESTDRANKKRFAIFVKTIDCEMVVSTNYLKNMRVMDGTGDMMVKTLKAELSKQGVDSSKVMGLGTDGATAMTGQGKGLTGMMMRDNPHIVNVHCIAHRLALCTSQAAEKVPAMKEYVEVSTSLFYYFKASASRCQKLEEIQQILESDKLHIKEVHQVRWLSFFEALETVHRNIVPLLTYLRMENAQAAGILKDPKAAGLKKTIATVKFIELTCLMMDVIPIVGALNLFFQAREIDIAMIKVKLESCMEKLADLKSGGKHLLKFKDQLVRSEGKTQFAGQDIAGSPVTDMIISTVSRFIDNLIDNIQKTFKRFPDTELLAAFGVLSMRPISFLPTADLDNWGNEKMEMLISHYAQAKRHEWKNAEGKMASNESPPIIDAEGAREEWKEVKRTVKEQMYPRDHTATLWHMIVEYHPEDFKTLTKNWLS